MVSTYHGVETGRRALSYFRKGMEIAGINTTKTGQEGYSRQVVNSGTTSALETGTSYSMLGTGVEVVSIERMRDLYLEARFIRAETALSYWSTLEAGAARVEKLIVSASEKSINNYLDSFWTAIQEVHKEPDNQAIRSVFLQEADTLSAFANSLYTNYNEYRDELNSDIRGMVEDANSYMDQIAILNKAIRTVKLAGAEPNELIDRRDLLVEKLCVLTGAEASKPADEADGDYKINLNGKLLVQGSFTRHLMLVKNPTNSNYYEVQVEYNQYDISSDADVAGVIAEQRALANDACSRNGVHEIDVNRLADELYWTVGYGLGQSAGGERIDGITDPNQALNIDGSFALQVGSGGVRLVSEAYAKTPPGAGVVLGPPGPGEQSHYTFRISAGSFESTVDVKWNGLAWEISDNLGNGPVTATGADGAFTVRDFGSFMAGSYSDHGIDVKYADNAITLESRDRQLISVTDLDGDMTRSSGLANENPTVMIEVTPEDTLQTIANKINNAYMFDRTYEVDADGNVTNTDNGQDKYQTDPPGTPPSSPEQWLRASVRTDENGECYLVLTSSVAGEANRINVTSGSVCGGGTNGMNVARLLGLVERASDVNVVNSDGSTGQKDVTSCIQFKDDGTLVNRYTPHGDVFVDDAWITVDGREYISSSNAFKEARLVAPVGTAAADALSEFTPGLRIELNGLGHTTVTVRHHLTQGAIFAAMKLRDDVILSQMDVFDDMMYKLASEFNAIHYAGYGSGEYADVTGMAFFEQIKNKYGAFGKLYVDPELGFDDRRLAVGSGDGSGHSLGAGDGTNALSIARLKQEKLFHNGIADFDDLYKGFLADLGSLGKTSYIKMTAEGYLVEQIGIQREEVSGVNSNEDMLSIVEMNQNFNYASQYISTILGVIDKIINGVGRVGI
ncbi:MAG: flagellar hook-associated protein FlgK [Synergistaceae bacterium]|jgi:flagellar hook-associated protein 1 FlgK|nr:flagellar hook-associated protein FlgK [Synergistaceae bacterium]